MFLGQVSVFYILSNKCVLELKHLGVFVQSREDKPTIHLPRNHTSLPVE